ncbi:hypothetical protein Dip510_000823 [Elusimicrobium posterum]|uniref:hypothetical protein n=1 Tax=Elusimicrobium posterum TaxID=3116653 RepID=UPI003C720C6F
MDKAKLKQLFLKSSGKFFKCWHGVFALLIFGAAVYFLPAVAVILALYFLLYFFMSE